MGYRTGIKQTCLLCGSGNVVGRGLCRKHYTQHHVAGTLEQFPKISMVEAFLSRIEKTDTCWLWRGNTNADGYGIFLLPGERNRRAHRCAFELFKSAIPDGYVVMHKCDNPPCVNPDHLELGTKLDNNRDAATKARTRSGVRHWNHKLTPAQVTAIRDDARTQAAIAAQYGVTPGTVSRIKSGKRRARG